MSSRDTLFVVLLDRQTATQTSKPVQVQGASKDIAITFTSEGTTSGGTLKINESDQNPYTGTWSQIGPTINASAFSGTAKQVYHIRMGAGGWFNVEIATTITGGGTVIVTASGM